MNNIEVNEIIKITQMPKVFSQLEMIGKFIDEKIKDIDILDCTEENKQEVKQRRTEINNILKELDDRRKFIKSKLLEPYEIFNDKYEQECKTKLITASEILKTKIESIEDQQKKDKYNELFDFAMEYIAANDIQDFVTFDDIGLNITLSASMKSLKEEIIAFCEKVKQDIELIEMEEYRDEILYEYKRNHNFAQCKMIVLDRYKEIKKLKEKEQNIKETNKQKLELEKKINDIIKVPEEIIEIQFTIKATKTQAQKLKEWLKNENIEYE